MKKVAIRTLIGLVVLVVVVALAIHFFLDAAIKTGVETVGPKIARVDIKPDVHLKDLGTGPDGITLAELARQILSTVTKSSIEASASAVADLGKGLGKSAVDAGGKVTNGIGDLFKKNK